MDFFNRFVLPPTREHLEVLRYLLVLASLVHFPFLGIAIGSTTLSLLFNLRDKDGPHGPSGRVAKALMDMAFPGRAAVFVFGVLPLPVLWVVYGQWLVRSTVNTMHLVPVGAIVIIAGLFLLMGYRATLRPAGGNSMANIGFGGAGLVALLAGTYVLLGGVTRFFDPEKWFLHHHAVRTLASWNVIWRYLMFVAASLATTGGAILFFFFRWPGSAKERGCGEERFIKNLGAGATLAGSVLFPVFGFFYLFTLPIVSLSRGLYGLGVAALVVLCVVSIYAYRAILSPVPRFGVRAFALFLALFALMIAGDQIALVNATREHIAGLVAEAEARETDIKIAREAGMEKAAVADPVRGAEVFKTVCSTCHRFDEKLVGPPLRAVLPKYAGRMEVLVSFIRKPSKADPEYPPMPAPGIPLADVKSVAAYLMGQLDPGSAADRELE